MARSNGSNVVRVSSTQPTRFTGPTSNPKDMSPAAGMSDR